MREVFAVLRGDTARFRRLLRVVAWHLAGVLNMVSKRKITVEMLLGEKGPGPAVPASKDDFKRQMREMQAKAEREKRA